jgi:hypothetical protein
MVMPLWEFKNLNKYGNIRTRIIHTDSSQFSFKPKGLGKFVGVKRFHYESRSPYFGILSTGGKNYLTPDWVEVIPGTTIEDVVHIPEVKVVEPKKQDEWLFESSSSPGQFYKVRQIGVTYKCNCPGVWRAKDRECKHIKSVKNV